MEAGLELKNESEWSCKNTAKRVIAYFFLSVLVPSSVAFYNTGFKVIGIVIGLIPLGYLIVDWTIIIRKSKRKKKME